MKSHLGRAPSTMSGSSPYHHRQQRGHGFWHPRGHGFWHWEPGAGWTLSAGPSVEWAEHNYGRWPYYAPGNQGGKGHPASGKGDAKGKAGKGSYPSHGEPKGGGDATGAAGHTRAGSRTPWAQEKKGGAKGKCPAEAARGKGPEEASVKGVSDEAERKGASPAKGKVALASAGLAALEKSSRRRTHKSRFDDVAEKNEALASGSGRPASGSGRPAAEAATEADGLSIIDEEEDVYPGMEGEPDVSDVEWQGPDSEEESVTESC